MSSDVVFDVKGLLKDLEALKPGITKQLKKDVRKVASPMQSDIKSAIPSVNPFESVKRQVSNTQGRLAWGAGKPANTVTISFKTGRSRKTATTALSSLVVSSPATALADVAGKGSGQVRRPVTNSYPYKGGERTHRVTTQGQKMIRHLRSKRATNFVYPAVEASLPMVQAEIKLIIERYAAKVNRKLN